ncbi:MAG TPA: hypothetical protein VGP93_19475, partial [Polyangiaceae bacterium]|nr:hypothetical protein [Polyangiaceae bacterium]
VRDALDRVLGGTLRRTARMRASETFREHSLRLTADDPLLYLGLDFGLSGYADRADNEWQEAFLPERLAKLLRHARVPVEGGGTRPLVRSEHVLFQAQRAPPRTEPPSGVLPMLGAGALFASLLALSAGYRQRAVARFAYALLLSIAGLLAGAAGGLLAFFWLATAHEAAWRNANLLLAPPWALAFVPAAVATALRRHWGEILLRRLALLTGASSLVALLLRVTGGVAQHDERIIALLLPVWLAVLIAEFRFRPLAHGGNKRSRSVENTF